MSKKSSNNSDAAKTWMAWGRHAVDSLRSKGLEFNGAPSAELTRKVDSMVMSRAYLESNDKPKIHLRYEYPMELFLKKAGQPRLDGFERSLPAFVEITKLFIPFTDGSALLLQMPSEDTIQCADYIKMLTETPEIARFMGADSNRLRALKEVVDLVFEANRVAALDAEDLSKYLAREALGSGLAKGARVQVNLASEKISLAKSVGLLLDFFQTPTDTVSVSVEQFIASEFLHKAKG